MFSSGCSVVDPVPQPTAVALLALLGTNTNLTVVDGDVAVGQEPPYVVVYLAGAPHAGDDLNGRSTEASPRAYVHSVGKTPAAARIVSGQVASTIIDQRLSVSGWSCGPIKSELSNPPERDESTGVVVMDQIDVYRWRMTAA
jgi:hypothetical protein